MTRRGLVVYNPVARGAPGLERLRAAFERADGWELALETTGAAGHAIQLARDAAARGFDAVVACGGDGTVNEAANGLAGSETALAVVRGGTANVWAKETGIPRRPERALAVLSDGETRAADLGRANERYYLLMAGVGFDAEVVRRVQAGLKRRIGAAAYAVEGARAALTYRSTAAELRAQPDGLSGDLYWLLLGNTRSYAGVLNVTYLARVDDGRLDLALLRRGGLHRLLWLLPFVLLRRHAARVHYRRVESLEIATPGLPVQVDGEYAGETPMRFEVAPGALRVIVPKGRQQPLFAETS